MTSFSQYIRKKVCLVRAYKHAKHAGNFEMTGQKMIWSFLLIEHVFTGTSK